MYFYHGQEVPLFLLTVYAKAVREDLSPAAKQALAEYVARIKRGQTH